MASLLLVKTIIILTATFSFANENSLSCIRLENIEIGCVPSVDHSCYKNKAVDKENSPCTYVADPGSSIRVEGPIAWHCAPNSEKHTEVCETVCNTDGCTKPCRIVSTCERYEPPICQETCVDCFNTVVTVNVGIERGCIICTRAKCPDEQGRDSRVFCPATYNGMVHYPAQKCSSDTRCPVTAIDNNGVTHNVNIRTANCQPPAMPIPGSPSMPNLCPWKEDRRTGGRPPLASDPGDPGNCEEISEDNRNP